MQWYYNINEEQLQQTYTPTTNQDYKKVSGTMKNQIELYSLVDDIGLWRLFNKWSQLAMTISSSSLMCFFGEGVVFFLKANNYCDDACNAFIFGILLVFWFFFFNVVFLVKTNNWCKVKIR
jgi:hypothetical protein